MSEKKRTTEIEIDGAASLILMPFVLLLILGMCVFSLLSGCWPALAAAAAIKYLVGGSE